jgi:hypothetical protein
MTKRQAPLQITRQTPMRDWKYDEPKKADIFDEIAEEKSKEKALKEKVDPRNAPDLSK